MSNELVFVVDGCDSCFSLLARVWCKDYLVSRNYQVLFFGRQNCQQNKKKIDLEAVELIHRSTKIDQSPRHRRRTHHHSRNFSFKFPSCVRFGSSFTFTTSDIQHHTHSVFLISSHPILQATSTPT